MGLIKNYFVEKRARKVVLNFDDQTLDTKVKIQGTKFDRKRKYNDNIIFKMKRDYKSFGMSISEISKKYNIPYNTVAYNVDEGYKKKFNEKRDGKHTGVDTITVEDRIQYKRKLIKTRKIKVAGVI